MSNGIVSSYVIKRLPRYYRFLGELKAQGITRISSRELSERMGLTASQIRQDLNCFGGFGQQGYGYNIELLQSEIAGILGLDLENLSYFFSGCLFLFSPSVVSDSLWPHGLQHARLPCPSPSPRACSNLCPLSWWCHPTISSSVIPFSSCLQSSIFKIHGLL